MPCVFGEHLTDTIFKGAWTNTPSFISGKIKILSVKVRKSEESVEVVDSVGSGSKSLIWVLKYPI